MTKNSFVAEVTFKIINLLFITKSSEKLKLLWFRSSHQRYSTKKAVLEHFIVVTGKHLFKSLQLYWKETPIQVFFCNFANILRTPISKKTYLLNGDPLLRWEKKILTLSIIELVDFVTNHFTVAFNPLLKEHKTVKKIWDRYQS